MKKIGIATDIGSKGWHSVTSQILGVLVSINAHWYLSQWADGRDPPTNPRAARVVWAPDPPRPRVVMFEDVSIVLRERKASCGPIAAMVAGANAAAAIRRASDCSPRTIARVLAQFTVELEPQTPPSGNSVYFHAVVHSPDGRIDPTAGLQRAA